VAEQGWAEVPVLVVGAGPAGLAATGALARLGIEVLLVERRREVLGLPRATVVSTRSMELLRSWGLQDEVAAGGVEVEWRLRVTETMAQSGRTLKLAAETKTIREVLELTDLAASFEHFDDVTNAVRSFL